MAMRLRVSSRKCSKTSASAPRVDGGGGLVQHQDVRLVAHEGARQGDLLPLAARQLAAVLEPFAELRVVPGGQRLDEVRGQALRRGAAPARLVVEGAHIARADVLAHQHLIAGKILENHADALAQRGLIPLLRSSPSSRIRPRVG